MARADWVSKGIRYQLARLLDHEPDQLWRYSQNGLSTFVQRRFRKDLRDVGALDVVLLRGQDVQVNLVVSLDPEGKGKTVLDWYAIPKRTFELGDGRTILRLYLGRHLRDLVPGRKAVMLKEMALMFFKQNMEDVARSRNVEKVIFVPSGLDAQALAQGLPRNIPARAREVFAGRGELAANLQELAQAPWKDMTLAGVSVLQSPQEPELAFGQAIESARLVNVAPRRDVPALLAATAERCASFGAACDIDDPNGLVGQTPLWTLDFSPPGRASRGIGRRGHARQHGKTFHVSGPARLHVGPGRVGRGVFRRGLDPGDRGLVRARAWPRIQPVAGAGTAQARPGRRGGPGLRRRAQRHHAGETGLSGGVQHPPGQGGRSQAAVCRGRPGNVRQPAPGCAAELRQGCAAPKHLLCPLSF